MHAKLTKEVLTTLCRMCDEHCAVNIKIKDGKPISVTGCSSHPWNQGRICGKALAALTMVNHADRLLKPLKRVNNDWIEIELTQALDEIAEKLNLIREQHGARAVGVWKGEAIGFAQEADLYRRFIHAFGSPNYFSNDSVCFIGRYMGYRLGFGLCGVPDCENSRCIVLWGSNPPASHPALFQRILRGRQSGAKLVVIDPRQTALAEQGDLHLPILPGTDGCLALGLARLLIESGWYDKDFVANHCSGFEKFSAHVQKFNREFVAQQTGLSVAAIEQLATLLHAAAPRVTIITGNGPEHQLGGVQGIRAIALLDALLGSFDRTGGTLWAEGLPLRELTLHQEYSLQPLGPIGAGEFPVTYDYRQECSTLRLMDTLLTENPYPVKALIMTAANPVLSNPAAKKVSQALQTLDLLVVRDLFLTQTARLAHYVLPAASFLERSELHCHGVLQVVNLTRRINSIPGVQDEYQFLRELARRLGLAEQFPWKDEDELNRWLLEPSGISADELAARPEGFQYKPIRYEKWRDQVLPTPSGKVEFASQYLAALGLSELPDYVAPTYKDANRNNEYPFVLISGTRQPLNAYGRHHGPIHPSSGPQLEMNPADAAELGLQADDPVRLSSRLGSIRLNAKILAPGALVRGCVVVAHGWPDSGVNELVSDDELDKLDGFPAMKSIPVKIEKT